MKDGEILHWASREASVDAKVVMDRIAFGGVKELVRRVIPDKSTESPTLILFLSEKPAFTSRT